MTQEEKDALYDEFVEKYEHESRCKAKEPLKEVRNEFRERFNSYKTDYSGGLVWWLNPWSEISGFVRKAFGERHIYRVEEQHKDDAVALARKLCDLYFETLDMRLGKESD